MVGSSVVDGETGEIYEVSPRGKKTRIPFAEEFLRDYAWLRAVLPQRRWIFAATMAANPHWYTLRENWTGEEFSRAVEIIRRYGTRVRYEQSYYTQLAVDDHFYWTMGWPVVETILINRKPFPAVDVSPAQRQLL